MIVSNLSKAPAGVVDAMGGVSGILLSEPGFNGFIELTGCYLHNKNTLYIPSIK
jgi:hypothetical protein